ncbi:MAG: ABC transporter substrate-binding protein [Deltaproteobacteria bacterium]|nr:ABC transporter substrate-binding protein [Deltaproteobacteria bacterium]
MGRIKSKHNNRNFHFMVLAMGLLLLAAALLVMQPAPAEADEGTVNVGIMAPLSGPGAPWGIATARVLELQFKQINDAGGVKVGNKVYKLKWYKEDDKYMGSAAAQAAARLIHDLDCKVIFGTNGSSPVLAMHPITTDNKVPVFCNSFADDAVSPERKYNFRTSMTSHQYAPVVWKYAKGRWPEIKRVAAIGQNDATGKEETNHIKLACEPLGIAVDIELFEPGQKEFYPLLTRVLAKKPDAMDPTCCALGSASLIMKQARELGFKGKFISSVFLDPTLNGPIAGFDNIEGSLTVTWDLANGSPGERAFYKMWCDNWNPKEFNVSPTIFYTGAEIWLEAIQKVGDIDADKVRNLIESGHMFNTTIYGKVKFSGKDYYGVDHQLITPVVISEVKDKKLVEIWRGK